MPSARSDERCSPTSTRASSSRATRALRIATASKRCSAIHRANRQNREGPHTDLSNPHRRRQAMKTRPTRHWNRLTAALLLALGGCAQSDGDETPKPIASNCEGNCSKAQPLEKIDAVDIL